MSEEFDDDTTGTPSEKDLDECYGGKYLNAADLGDKRIRTRIVKVRKEPMQQKDGKPGRPKLVIYTTLDKPMVVNATNKNTLVDKLGGDPADWIGAEVGLLTEPTQFAGKPTRGLRLRVLNPPKAQPKSVAALPSKPAPKPAAAAEEMPPDYPDDPGFQGTDADFSEAAE
jgi:hypothetical protein